MNELCCTHSQKWTFLFCLFLSKPYLFGYANLNCEAILKVIVFNADLDSIMFFVTFKAAKCPVLIITVLS